MIAGLYELPEGWRWVRLGEACQPTEVRDPGKQPESEFTYVDISSIDNTEGQIISPKRLKGAEAPSRARKVIRANDVIFATTRPYLKNIALVPDEFDNQICSTGFCVLRAKRSLTDSSWLFYLCRADLVVEQLNERMRGASYPAVTDVDVLSTLIPLPPLPEQRRIVARIEALFERIREARRLREAARRDADALLQAAMAEVFPHPDLPMPNGWKLLAVADFASKPQYGYTQSAKEEPVGPKFLRM